MYSKEFTFAFFAAILIKIKEGGGMDNRQLALACRRAYKEKTDSYRGVEVMHIYDHKYTIFAIRGTEAEKFFSARTWLDVIRDLAIWPKSIKSAHGHAGFVSGWREAFRMISDEIVDNPHKPIILTGHSLGGAIAIVGAYNLLEIGCRIEKVVTFGAPRALDTRNIDQSRARELKARTFEYIHARDPVPHFLKGTRYRHINKVILGSGVIWLKRRVRFHAMDNYINLL